jgi:subtilase family serine protease
MPNLAQAENVAAALGANVISNSWGGAEFSGEQNPAFNHPGVVITASSGDSGFGTSYPAADSHVVAVGGTRLTLDAAGRRSSETVWEGAGSGCSRFVSAQSFQLTAPNWSLAGCSSRRGIADVSAVAAPDTGVYVRYTPPGGAGTWYQVGGTSLSAPLVGAVFALAGNTSGVAYPAQLLYQHPTSLFDVTSGSNGSCSSLTTCRGAAGYDGPTGLGTPNGLGAF